MSKVSVVIPNYNASTYITECIDSIEKNESELEIIVVDDGSTDDSQQLLADIAKNDRKLTVIEQPNMNASVARNRGLEQATGKYIIFVDSDDMLEPNAIDLMVNEAEKTGAQLVLGNHVIVNKDGKYTKNGADFSEKSYVETTPLNLVDRVPYPANKLFSLEVIHGNKMAWGNVRIGQDIDFFLKYLGVCKKVAVLKDVVSKWRILSTSMSHAPSFRILDIVNSFEDIHNYYIQIEKEGLYKDYIQCVAFEHLNRQMEKQKFFSKRSDRKLIVNYFSYFLNKMIHDDLKQSKSFPNYKRRYLTCRLKLSLKWLYTTSLYSHLMKNR